MAAAVALAAFLRARKRKRLKLGGVLTHVTITGETWSRGIVRFKQYSGYFKFGGQEVHFKDRLVSEPPGAQPKPRRLVVRVNPRKPTDYLLEYEDLVVAATYIISVDQQGKAFDIEARGAIDAAYAAEAERRIKQGTFPKRYQGKRTTINLAMESPLRSGIDEVWTDDPPVE